MEFAGEKRVVRRDFEEVGDDLKDILNTLAIEFCFGVFEFFAPKIVCAKRTEMILPFWFGDKLIGLSEILTGQTVLNSCGMSVAAGAQSKGNMRGLTQFVSKLRKGLLLCNRVVFC